MEHTQVSDSTSGLQARRTGQNPICRATLFGTALTLLGFAVAPASAGTFSDGFEPYGTTSGPLSGYNGWNTSSTYSTGDASEIVETDGMGYGPSTNYLRLVDPNDLSASNGTAHPIAGAGKTFSSTPVYADGATISFALRDDATLNNNQVKIYGTSNSYPALQLGIKNTSATPGTNDTAAFTYTSYNGTTATAGTFTGTVTVSAATWYLLAISYSVNPTTFAGTYTLTINGAAANGGAAIPGQLNFANLGNANLSSIVLATSSTAYGNADFDSLSLSNSASDPAPEPASIAGLALLTSSLILRRRRPL